MRDMGGKILFTFMIYVLYKLNHLLSCFKRGDGAQNRVSSFFIVNIERNRPGNIQAEDPHHGLRIHGTAS